MQRRRIERSALPSDQHHLSALISGSNSADMPCRQRQAHPKEGAQASLPAEHCNSTMPTIHVSKRVYSRGEYDPLRRAMRDLGWSEAPHAHEATMIWDICDGESRLHLRPLPSQLLNRFAAMPGCCCKGVFAQLVARVSKLLTVKGVGDIRFMPQQWALPGQQDELAKYVRCRAAAARCSGMAPVYIVKPNAGSQGDGIALVNDPCHPSCSVAANKAYVVQEYIDTPMLHDGLKFDLRIYVLVTSIAPLEAFVCREGLARFAVEPYEYPARENLRNIHMHLTNYSLNKKAEGFKFNGMADGGVDGSKRTASSVFAALAANGQLPRGVESVWQDIEALVARSLLMMQPVLSSAQCGRHGRSNPMQPRFQILGFDVLLDATARAWLMEINNSPSFRIDFAYDDPGKYSLNGASRSVPSPVDEAIKVPMLMGALRIVAGLHKLRCTETRSRPAENLTDDDMDMDGRWTGSGAFGTSYHSVDFERIAEDCGFQLLDRLAHLFNTYTPKTVRRENGWASGAPPGNNALLAAPGPRWRAAAFVRFLESTGLLAATSRPDGALSFRGLAGLGRPEVDLIFLSTCGAGGGMGVVEFCEACAKIARKLWPEVRFSSDRCALQHFADAVYDRRRVLLPSNLASLTGADPGAIKSILDSILQL